MYAIVLSQAACAHARVLSLALCNTLTRSRFPVPPGPRFLSPCFHQPGMTTLLCSAVAAREWTKYPDAYAWSKREYFHRPYASSLFVLPGIIGVDMRTFCECDFSFQGPFFSALVNSCFFFLLLFHKFSSFSLFFGYNCALLYFLLPVDCIITL